MADPGTTNTSATARGCTSCGASNAPSARFCAACGAGLPPLNSAGTAPGSLAALLDDARQHLLLGHWEDAGLAAEAVLTLDPGSAEGHHIAARARLRQGMTASALTHAEHAVEMDPGNNEYQSTLAEAIRANDSDAPRLNMPALVASVVALLVFGLIAAVVMISGRGREPERMTATSAQGPAGPASPFAQPPANAPFPQPQRSPGVDVNRPRIAGRTAAPPAPTGSGSTGVTASPLTGALPPAGRTPNAPTDSTLAPAPVDTAPLQRFPEPAPTTPAPSLLPAPRSNTPAYQPYTQPPAPAGVVAAPPAQPGGTIFGPSPSGPARSTNPSPSTNPFTSAPLSPGDTGVPAPSAPRQAPASPQQNYVQRDYGGAIQGLQQRIAAGQATGANYQQLGSAYVNVGDTASAASAYQSAVAAYRAQIQAGQDVELATRGLRNSELQLRMLMGR